MLGFAALAGIAFWSRASSRSLIPFMMMIDLLGLISATVIVALLLKHNATGLHILRLVSGGECLFLTVVILLSIFGGFILGMGLDIAGGLMISSYLMPFDPYFQVYSALQRLPPLLGFSTPQWSRVFMVIWYTVMFLFHSMNMVWSKAALSGGNGGRD